MTTSSFARGIWRVLASMTLVVTACAPSEPKSASDHASVSGAAASDVRRPLAGRPPGFELYTLGGELLSLDDHLGRDVILIDFWATFCAPCLVAMPHLDALYRRHADDGFVVLGVSIDGPESVAQVRSTVSKLGVSFPILLDPESRAVGLYNPKTSAPYSVLIARDGQILARREGYSTGEAQSLDADVAAAVGLPR